MYTIESNLYYLCKTIHKPQSIKNAIEYLKHECENPIQKWGTLTMPWIFLSYLDNNLDMFISKLCYSTELISVLRWVNKNILCEFNIYNERSLNVKIRIATSMLNNLVKNNVVKKQDAMIIHDNMVHNINFLNNRLSCEELPFY